MSSETNGGDGRAPRSLGSRIAGELREEIVLGRLRAGARLSQEALCKRLGTSRMPVRDALLRLVQEGLVEVSPGGQYAVARLTTADVADAFEIEALVHGRAARRATLNASADDLDDLDALVDEMIAAERNGTLDELAPLHWQFHRRLNLLARSPKLSAVTRNVSVGIPRAFLLELPHWAARANAIHVEIVEAMRARDAEQAERLVRRLLEESGADLVAHLEEQRLLERRGRRGRTRAAAG